MRLTITNDDGVMFITHKIDGTVAAWMLYETFGPLGYPRPPIDDSGALAQQAEDVVEDIKTALKLTTQGKDVA